jgi:hypothetical protein
MRKAKSFSEVVVNLNLMSKNVEPRLEEFPFLKPVHEEMTGLIGRAQDLDQRLEIARGESKELLNERREVVKQAKALGLRMATHLKASMGFTNERLADFGITPRPRVTRPRTKRRKEPGPQAASGGSTPPSTQP